MGRRHGRRYEQASSGNSLTTQSQSNPVSKLTPFTPILFFVPRKGEGRKHVQMETSMQPVFTHCAPEPVWHDAKLRKKRTKYVPASWELDLTKAWLPTWPLSLITSGYFRTVPDSHRKHSALHTKHSAQTERKTVPVMKNCLCVTTMAAMGMETGGIQPSKAVWQVRSGCRN